MTATMRLLKFLHFIANIIWGPESPKIKNPIKDSQID